MNKKILSLALAASMLVSISAQAASLKDYLNGKPAYASYLEDGVFSYTKFKSEIAPKITTKVRLSGDPAYEAHSTNADALSGSADKKVFDYESTIDMTEVKKAFAAVSAVAKDLIFAQEANKDELITKFDNSVVDGSFKVKITYNSGLVPEHALTAADIELKQNGAAPEIFEIDEANCDFTANPAVVAFKVKGAPKASDLAANDNKLLDNLSVALTGFTASVNDTYLNVSVSMTGETTVKDGADVYAKMDYKSNDESGDNQAVVIVRTRTSGSGGSLGSGSSTTTPKAYTVIDGIKSEVKVKTENGVSTVDTEAIAAPEKEGYTFDGWYLDEALTKPAEKILTIKNTTYLYPKFTPVGEVNVYTVVDGVEEKQELKEEDGKKYVDIDSIAIPEKVGFAFEGWYLNPYFTEPAAGNMEVTETIFLYPHFINTVAPEQLESEDHIIYIVGYPDGTVRPNDNITREEVVAAFYRLLKADYRATVETTENSFLDVDESRWSNISISTLANAGIIVGDIDGNFNPTNPITRAEFAVIASKFAPKDALVAANNFSDIDTHWAKDAILIAAAQGWITGYDDGSFKPDAFITRAEAMTIINKMLVRYGDHETGYAKEWSDVSKTDWFYGAVIEATTYNLYERAENGWQEKWTGNGEEMTQEEVNKIIENENPEELN